MDTLNRGVKEEEWEENGGPDSPNIGYGYGGALLCSTLLYFTLFLHMESGILCKG